MTSFSTEVYSSSYENQTDEIPTDFILPGINLNDSCEPDCHLLFKPNETDEDLITRVLFSFAVIFLLATICIAVIFHRFQTKSQIQQRRKNESLQNGMINAHPFEEISIIDGTQSTELTTNQ